MTNKKDVPAGKDETSRSEKDTSVKADVHQLSEVELSNIAGGAPMQEQRNK